MFSFSRSPTDRPAAATKAYLAFPPGFTHTPLETLKILQEEATNALQKERDALEASLKEQQTRQAHARALEVEMRSQQVWFEEWFRAEALEGEKNWVRGGGVLRDERTGRVDMQRTEKVRRMVEMEDRERAIRGRWEAYERKWLELAAAGAVLNSSTGPSRTPAAATSASTSPGSPSVGNSQRGSSASPRSDCTGADTGAGSVLDPGGSMSTLATRLFGETQCDSTLHTRTRMPTPKSPKSEPVTFAMIPWPLIEPPKGVEDIRDPERIGEFLFESLELESNKKVTRRERVRASLKRWHPDKLGGLFARVREDEMEAVKEGIDAVVISLMKLQESVKASGRSS